jgi:hypothetical protein
MLYNLPFLLAFDLLKQVLMQESDEDKFTGFLPELGDLMDSAKTSLTWVNWQCLREGVKRQNEVAHSGKLFGDIQCLQDIAYIESQLASWGIISTV